MTPVADDHKVPGMLKGVLIDLAGVVYQGDTILPGALEAIEGLGCAQLPFRFLTNTTRKSLHAVEEQISAFGIAVERSHVFTPAQAAAAWLENNGRSPHLLVHPDLEADFAGCRGDLPKALVVGDAGPFFTYERLNEAFRVLEAGAPFIALATNRVFRDSDGELSMDAGGFVKALEFASRVNPIVMGKPAPAFYASAAASMGLSLAEVAMVGDDAEVDVAGALDAGAGIAVLVRTGKYRPGDEDRTAPGPTAVVEGLLEAVSAIRERSIARD